MKGWICVLSAFLMASAVDATPLIRYIAVNPRMIVTGVVPYNSPGSDAVRTTDFYFGQGARIEFGVARAEWSAFVGMDYDCARESKIRDDSFRGSFSYEESHEHWTGSRLILGLRAHSVTKSPNRVVPLIGIRASYGWLKQTYFSDHFWQSGNYSYGGSEVHSQTSPGRFGFGFDLGVFIATNSPVVVVAAITYDNLMQNLTQDKSYWLDDVTGVYTLALQLGLQYRFQKMHTMI